MQPNLWAVCRQPQYLQPLRPACNELLLDGQHGAVHSCAANVQQYDLGNREQRVLRQPVCWTCLVLMDWEIMVDFLVWDHSSSKMSSPPGYLWLVAAPGGNKISPVAKDLCYGTCLLPPILWSRQSTGDPLGAADNKCKSRRTFHQGRRSLGDLGQVT